MLFSAANVNYYDEERFAPDDYSHYQEAAGGSKRKAFTWPAASSHAIRAKLSSLVGPGKGQSSHGAF